MEKTNVKIIAENRKARHDYAIHETFETGVVLTGTEVKSLRAGKANLKDSYAAITKSGELYLYNLHISEYDHGNIFNHEPRRDRKLLMHKREIACLLYTSGLLSVFEAVVGAVTLGEVKELGTDRSDAAKMNKMCIRDRSCGKPCLW